MSQLRIRHFDEDDWQDFWPILRAVVDAGETYALDPSMTLADAQEFWTGPANANVVTVRDGSTLLGSAKMGANRPAQGSHVGTASFMVADEARGRGVGRALGEYVVQWHRDHGFRAIQFNAVVSTNTAAVRLWQSLGFEIIGTVPGAFRRPSGEYADLHVMHLDLT
ncbi:MAG: GNAT family N-acetyltransferase [Myxococcales bacterium]|nr:MAG: GNAT family N-acetyltransferase [Myxococcales bacterium]